MNIECQGTQIRDINEIGVIRIVAHLQEKNSLPVTIFKLSQARCMAIAEKLSIFDFNSTEEKDLVDEIFDDVYQMDNNYDVEFTQVNTLKQLLRQGIGVHYRDLLPCLKAVIEELYLRGLLKVICATETLSVGLNMPTKAVVITDTTKFNEHRRQALTASEYTQMAGRAGRRNLDDKGTVILITNDYDWYSTIKKILRGNQTPINSKFHFSYDIVLRMLRAEIDKEYMIEWSFFNFQHQLYIQDLKKEIHEIQVNMESFENNHSEAEIQYALTTPTELEELDSEYEDYKEMESDLRCAKEKLRKNDDVLYNPLEKLRTSYNNHTCALRKLGYCRDNNVLTEKGHFAINLQMADEILITEMVFSKMFDKMSSSECAALISCFVFKHKISSTYSSVLFEPFCQMNQLIFDIVKKSDACGAEIRICHDQYNRALVATIFDWCNQKQLSACSNLKLVPYEDIVTCLNKIKKLMQKLIQAAEDFEYTNLKIKFSAALLLLERPLPM